MGFAKDFVWGAATSAYQIEGAGRDTGKGLNIWDVYTKDPGRVYGGHTGDIACDHYHRFREDVEYMKEIGLKAYRFSIDWTRVLPEGTGRVNEEGIRFYNAFDRCSCGIELNLILRCITGNCHMRCTKRRLDESGYCGVVRKYARLVAERFSDRVTHFFTLNEPQCFVGLGFLQGVTHLE